MKFGPMYEQYLILDHYHPNRTVDKEEQDRRHMLQMDWRELIQMAEDKQKDLQDKQANFLQKLIEDVTQFIGDVHSFHDEYTREGPMVPNIDPSEAQNRLKEFTERYEMNKRKFDIYENGESLFGLPHQEYPKLVQIDNELRNLSKLYKLYSEVLDTLNDWRDMLWSEIDVTMISDWMDDIEKFKKQCVALPRDLKAW
jgi:dynein heavy chain